MTILRNFTEKVFRICKIVKCLFAAWARGEHRSPHATGEHTEPHGAWGGAGSRARGHFFQEVGILGTLERPDLKAHSVINCFILKMGPQGALRLREVLRVNGHSGPGHLENWSLWCLV